MADVKVYGNAGSSYVRTARMALEEKGVPYDLVPLEMRSASHEALHPFLKMPALTHGELALYETAAISRYVDDAFDGPSLTPGETRWRAEMEKWISNLNAYLYPTLIRGIVLERFAPRIFDRPTDEAKITDALPEAERQAALLERELSGRTFFAGDAISIADLFVVPVLFYVSVTPEGKSLLGGKSRIERWLGAMTGRPSFAATAPPMASAS